MTIDITPEAVEHLCAIHDGYEQHGTAATLRALSAANEDAYLRGFSAGAKVPNSGAFTVIDSPELASLRDALTASLAETAAAYEVAANICDREWEAEQHSIATRMWPIRANADYMAEEIRLSTPTDSKAALDRMIADADDRGMRKAAGIVDDCVVIMQDALAKATGIGERMLWESAIRRAKMIRDDILADIPKGGDK